MDPSPSRTESCAFPNFFSSALAPTVEEHLPEPGSLASAALDHTTRLPSFVTTVADDLCDDGRMSAASRHAAVGFISRSSTAAAVAGGAVTMAAVGVATAGAPLAALGVGVAGLLILPPLVEWAAHKAGSIADSLLHSVRRERRDY